MRPLSRISRCAAPVSLGVALAFTGSATADTVEQPIWQPAIYCAALDFTRADLLTGIEADLPEWAGTPDSATKTGRAYLRIAAEALDCPPQDEVTTYLSNARIGIQHRIRVATGFGISPETMVLPIASESELVCELTFAPELLAEMRAHEEHTPPDPICGWAE